METEGKLSLAEVFVSITDPRQAKKVQHDLVELLVVAVNAVLVGADTFVEIELWARERLDWLRSYLRLKHGIPSHDTFGRLFGLIDPGEFGSLPADAKRLAQAMPPITSPSSSTSRSTSSASIPSSAKAVSQPDASSPQLPTPIANICSGLFDVHAIYMDASCLQGRLVCWDR